MAGLRDEARLLGGLLAGDRALGGPLLVLADLTGRCNLACPGCRYHSPQLDTTAIEEDISPALFERLCDELAALGTRRLILTGEGEPLLHPEWTRLLACARGRGLDTTLYTNATLLDRTAVAAMLASPPDTLVVSLWAASAETYRQAYPGAPDRFATIVGNVRELSRRRAGRGPRLRLYHPINRSNHRDLAGLPDLARAMGCDEVHVSPFRTRRGRLDALALDPTETRTVCAALRSLRAPLARLGLAHNLDATLRRYAMGKAGWARTPCYVGWVQAQVQSDGAVHPCKSCNRPMGNLREQSFAEIWNGPDFRRFRRGLLSPEGMQRWQAELDCEYCGQLPENERIHQVFRWLAPARRVIALSGLIRR
jgi:MoaA/NifB/PqqE/SkfB family radical SAM enzyme